MVTHDLKTPKEQEAPSFSETQQDFKGKSPDVDMKGRETSFALQGQENPFEMHGSKELFSLAKLVSNDYTADDTAIAEHVHSALESNESREVFAALQRLGRQTKKIAAFKAAYQAKYHIDAEADIRAKQTGDALVFSLELIGVKDDKAVVFIPKEPPSGADEFAAVADQLYNALVSDPIPVEQIYGILTGIKGWTRKMRKVFEAYEKKYASKLSGKGFEADLELKLKGDDLSYALYILHAPGPTVRKEESNTISNVKVNDASSQKGTVIGGNVEGSASTSYDNSDASKTTKNNFSFSYKGALSEDTRWMQFVWSQLLVTEPTVAAHPVGGAYRSSNDKKNEISRLSMNEKNPDYDVDSVPGTPFYEDSGVHYGDAQRTIMIDKPESNAGFIKSAFENNPQATKMSFVKHFDTYLIRDFYVLYHYAVTVQWDYAKASDTPAPTQNVVVSEAADALPKAMWTVMTKKYPQYKYIRSV